MPDTSKEIDDLVKSAEAFLDTHRDWMTQTQSEIDVLRSRDFKAADKILKRKQPINDLYQKQLKFLFDRKEILQALPPEIKKTLRESQDAFVAISAEYQKELALTLKLIERLMNMLKSALVEHVTTSHFYGETGTLTKQETPRSVTVNKNA